MAICDAAALYKRLERAFVIASSINHAYDASLHVMHDCSSRYVVTTYRGPVPVMHPRCHPVKLRVNRASHDDSFINFITWGMIADTSPNLCHAQID
jgi:hypothetical protein